jgi:hypothetical protein
MLGLLHKVEGKVEQFITKCCNTRQIFKIDLVVLEWDERGSNSRPQAASKLNESLSDVPVCVTHTCRKLRYQVKFISDTQNNVVSDEFWRR